MSRIALVVEYEVKPEFRQEFETLIRGHAKATLDEDEGCVAFEVLIPQDDPNRIFLYECYADADAYAAHNASSRLAETRSKYAEMLANRRITVCDAR